MFIRSALFFGYVLVSSAVLAAAPAADVLTKPCAECHGPDGASSNAKTAQLNGQLGEYLAEQIGALSQGRRTSSVAEHIPKDWSDADIAAVAKFYAKRKATRPQQSTDPELVAQGQAIYQKRCAECHPDNGRASDHDAPLMAAQNLDYMMAQAREFVAGKRKFVFMMDTAFKGLSPAELDSVAHFFASQAQSKK